MLRDVHLLLSCSVHDGTSIHGVFSSEERANRAFLELAEGERAMAVDSGMPFDEDTLMHLNWDYAHEGIRHGWAVRRVCLDELYAIDVAMSPV